MKNFLFFFSITLFLVSCNNKTLYLPQVAVSGISKIQNHSQIWVFYKHDKDKIKAQINRNNTINSTHWIINIDKRLPLSEVIPVFHLIKAKRAKKSIHSADDMNNYLSYSDVLENKIALFPIDGIQYIILPKNDIDQILLEKPCKNTIEFSTDLIKINQKEIQLDQWSEKQVAQISSGCIQLVFNENLSYQKYMEYRLQMDSFNKNNIKIEPTEFIIK